MSLAGPYTPLHSFLLPASGVGGLIIAEPADLDQGFFYAKERRLIEESKKEPGAGPESPDGSRSLSPCFPVSFGTLKQYN